jgi:hypothetical protein
LALRKRRLYAGVMRGQIERMVTLFSLVDKARTAVPETLKVFNTPELQNARDELLARANLLLSVYLFEDGTSQPPLPPV